MNRCNPNIGAPRFVAYFRDVGLNLLSILVAVITTPSIVHWCPISMWCYQCTSHCRVLARY